MDHGWWAGELRARAMTLAAVFAIDLLAVAVSEYAIALTLRCRPELAARWSDDEARRRVGAMRAARNLFANPQSPGVRRPSAAQVDPRSARATLTDDRRYRRALVGWVGRKRRVILGRDTPISPAQVTVRTSATDDPAPVAAGLLVFLAWSEERQRSITRGPVAAVPQAFRSIANAPSLAALVGELRGAAVTAQASRPRSRALRELLGDDRFDAMQRLAVGVLNEPLVAAEMRKDHVEKGGHAMVG